MKRLMYLIFLINYSFAMEFFTTKYFCDSEELPTVQQQPQEVSSLKLLSSIAIAKAIIDEQFTGEEVLEALPALYQEEFKAMLHWYSSKNPKEFVNTLLKNKGLDTFITLDYVYRPTPDFHYGIAVMAEHTCCFDLETGDFNILGKKEDLYHIQLSENGKYALKSEKDEAHVQYGTTRWRFFLQNIPQQCSQELSINDEYHSPCFCGNNYILFNCRDRGPIIFKITQEDNVVEMGETPSLYCWELKIALQHECIIFAGNSEDKYFYLVDCQKASIIKKWPQIYQYVDHAISVYEPQRLIAFLSDKRDGSKVQISRLDDSLIMNQNKQVLPALQTIENGGAIQSTCFANDGKWFVTGGDNTDGKLRIWDIQKYQKGIVPLLIFNPHEPKLRPLDYLFYQKYKQENELKEKLFFKDGWGIIHSINLTKDVAVLKEYGRFCQAVLAYEKKKKNETIKMSDV